MAGTGVLERRAGSPRSPEPPPRLGRRARTILLARRSLTLLLVIAATFTGGYLALVSFSETRNLSVGEIRMSMSPGHRGSIDLYVPLVDWGARFEVIRLPVRLRVDLQTVNRTVAGAVAQGEPLNLESVRTQARDAIAGYLKLLIGLVMVGGAALGLLVAFAIRSRAGPRLRWTSATAVGAAIAMGVAMIVLIPPRGEIKNPQYYAHGPDIPVALRAVEAARRTGGALDQELDAQFVGLARLVIDPGRRRSLTGEPVVTIASDLHNNTVFGLQILENAANGGPIFFPGDLTDRGTPLETRLVRQVVRAGHPFVFVTGNHDSDFLAHELAAEGAIVLTRRGRLMPKGGYGPMIVKVAGLRVAGYDDPFERLTEQDFKDRYDNTPDPAQQDAFTAWLRPLLGKVDVVMVHEPALIQPALAILRDDPPSRPIVFMVGHTHKAELDPQPGVTVINSGSVGAGGPSNLTEKVNYGIARFTFTLKPSFQPLAADLVTIDPGTGDSSARRTRLDPSSG
jgi:predicted phosphodiesterase